MESESEIVVMTKTGFESVRSETQVKTSLGSLQNMFLNRSESEKQL